MPDRLNEICALDVMHDALYGGRRFRTLNVLVEGHREGLAIQVGTSIPAPRVVHALDQRVTLYGRPQPLRLDNGPELTAQVFVCRLVRPAWDCPALHPAGQARAERLARFALTVVHARRLDDTHHGLSMSVVGQLKSWLKRPA